MGEGSTKRRLGGAGLLLTRDNVYSAKDTTPAGRGRGQGISKNHAIVCIEDIRVSNMTSSAGGSIQSPGSKVGARSVLNRSILDQGWTELRSAGI